MCGFGYAQQNITLIDGQVYQTNAATIYDAGGLQGSIPNLLTRSSIKAASGYIHLMVTEVDIPLGSQLKIYQGLDTTELIGFFDGVYKPVDYYGKAFTLVYDPKGAVQTRSGFVGKIEPVMHEFPEKVTLPESDCIGAIPLCGNSTVNTSANQYENTGNVNDDSGSCYSGTGNGGSVWYSFSPQTNGQLDFLITPTGSTDYDFVLWDITNGCASKTQISCNYSATHAATGLASAGTTNSQDASGTTTNQLENVLTTHVYALCINYYSGNNDGFILNFHNLASTVNIVDNIPPTITSAYSPNCTAATQFTVNFSEYIDCNTLQASDFSIPGYTVSILASNCTNGKTNSVVIGVSPAMPPGNYSMTVNNMTDMCGNPLNQVYPISTLVVPVANAGPDNIACSTAGFFGTTNYGTVNLTGSGGSSYLWSTGQTGATISVTPNTTTTYTLTAISGGCSSTDQVVVTVAASPTPSLGPDQTICSGFPVTLNASGGGTYQWQSTTSTNFFGQPTGWTNIAGATSSSYTGNPTGTIYYQVIVTNAAGCSGSDVIKITIGSGTFGITAPPFICQGSSVTLSLPSSMTAYTWDVAGTPVGSANTPLTVSPSTTTTYTAVSTTVGCTGSASVTVPVHPLSSVVASANPTSACAGVPVDLSSNAPTNSSSTVSEDFETTNSLTLINGTYNKWYYGTAGTCSGTKALYIGTAVGNNNYSISSGFAGLTSNQATNHAYKDIAVTSYCTANLSFKWRNNGNSNAALTVWLVPTTFVPVAGTAIVAGSGNVLLGGPYFDGLTCTNQTFDLTAYAGQSVRIVFSWNNTGGLLAPAVENTAAMIDDILFNESTTYTYSWTSSPAGFSASTLNATANPTGATSYSFTATRCDGCPMAASIDVIDCNALPVSLVDFYGEKRMHINQLYWKTENEIESSSFILERSENMLNWSVVGQIPSENSHTPKLYTYEDSNFPLGGTSYYRLIQVDKNGNQHAAEKIVVIVRDNSELKIVMRTNILGQLVDEEYNGLVIIHFSDGTSQTRLQVSN